MRFNRCIVSSKKIWFNNKLISHALSLHENIATVTFILRNKGRKDGTEVCLNFFILTLPTQLVLQIPQLYLQFPQGSNSPPQVLRGFSSVFLHQGEIQVVKFDLTRYDLSIWDTGSQKWVIPSGSFGVTVGASSRDKRLTGHLNLW